MAETGYLVGVTNPQRLEEPSSIASVVPEAPAAPVIGAESAPTLLGALRIRNFRLFVFGAFVSNMGTWLQSVALSWLILELTDRAFWVSMVVVAQFAPMLVFGLAGGVVADRFNRRRILITTQALLMASATALTVVTASGWASLGTLMPIVLFGGCALAFNAPAFQSFISDLVPRTHVPVAVSLNASQFSLSRVLGPALAGYIMAASGAAGGLLIAGSGAATAFGLNAVSFLAVIVGLLMIRIPKVKAERRKISRDTFKGAFATVQTSSRIKAMLLVAVAISLLSAPAIALLPVFAKKVLAGDAGLYGRLFAGFGVGAALGSLASARLVRLVGYKRLVILGMVSQAVLLTVFAMSTSEIVCLLAIAAYGILHAAVLSSTSSGLQLAAPPSRRGRVMSLFMMAFAGLYPLGAFLSGIAADRVGAPRTLVASAVGLAVAAVVGWVYGDRLTGGPQEAQASSSRATA